MGAGHGTQEEERWACIGKWPGGWRDTCWGGGGATRSMNVGNDRGTSSQPFIGISPLPKLTSV